MTLSYLIDLFGNSAKRKKVRAKITIQHSASSYGQPVIVLATGDILDLVSWVGRGYQVVKATEKEKAQLRRLGLTV